MGKRTWFLLLAALLALACGGGSSPSPSPSAPLTLQLDPSASGTPIPTAILGLDTPWTRLGDGIMQGGELIQDRSFRTLGTPGSPWQSQGPGTVTRLTTGGDPSPQGAGPADPGCARIVGGPTAGDLTGLIQVLLGPVKAGTPYQLCLSAYAEAGAPSIYVALGVPSPFASLTPTQYVATTTGAWTRARITLTPSQDAPSAELLVGVVGPGTVRLDEVRCSAAPDGRPSVDPLVLTRLGQLGTRVLRWPGGRLADTFDWKGSVGPTLQRGESPDLSGGFQTPALGLDEFLQLCEAIGATPIVQVNVLAPASEAADLVDYCNGGTNTPMGALRAANGHPAPYGVLHFELGNEPSPVYGGGDQAGSAYAALASTVAKAMLAREADLQLSGAVEASFALADWRSSVPLLANWTPEVLTPGAGLTPLLSALEGHYYSYFDTDPDEATRFRRLMAAGTVLERTRDALAGQSPLPLWITEYHVALEQNGVLQPGYLVDAASGLAVADETLALMQGGFQGACAFNLAEASGFGVLVHPGAWDLRPAGLALELLAPFAGESRLPATLAGVGSWSLGVGKGNIPTGTQYPLVAVLASRTATGRLRLALLNRSWDQPQSLVLGQAGPATLTWLAPADLSATNESAPVVALATESRSFVASGLLTLPPHSLVRVDF